MEVVYNKHRATIISLFNENDIKYILTEPLKSNFNESAIERILMSENEKVKIFFEEFDMIKTDIKFLNFIEVSTDVSEWIARFLISEDDGDAAHKQFDISYNLINKNGDFFIENLSFDVGTLKNVLNENLITSRNYAMLLEILYTDGELIAKHRFFPLIHVYSVKCYSKFLYLCSVYNRIYLEIFHTDLFSMIDGTYDTVEIRDYIDAVSSSEMENYVQYNDSIDVMASIKLDSSPESIETNSPSTSSYKKNDDKYEDSSNDDEDVATNRDFDSLFGLCKNKPLSEMLTYKTVSTSSDDSTLEMRQYQNELAKQAVEGKNVLICAPTSSGKTVVAIKIAEEHMKINPSGKIALVVPTTVLVDQQFNLFWKYLRKKCKINKLSGGSKTISVSLSKQINDYDIFVFTCGILVNALDDQDEPLRSISDFSLIIFDECHHCDKDHLYNKVMDHYFKDQQADKPVPQIIGMTASTGTDKATNVDAALKSLISLCANLDSHIISTVTINIDELNKNIPTPSNEVKSPGSRSTDLFESSLLTLISSIEVMVYGIFKSKKKPIGIPEDRYHDKYLSFVKGLTNLHPDLLSDQERRGVKIIEYYLENLYRALIINHLFLASHAIEMLKEKISTKGPVSSDTELTLRQQFNDFLLSTSLEQDKNPSLDCLKQEIKRQISDDRKSRIIVFVKEVNYARILESDIQSARLGFIECKALVGTNKAADQGGLSKSESEDIVAKFRSGIINLLFATSVAEEGLDVEKCNLVVRYGYVTNEISMVQSRGRARASNSKYVVIVPEKLKWQINKENINKHRETMMHKAIDKFQAMDPTELKRQIFECQEKRHALRTTVSPRKCEQSSPKSLSNTYWDLHCYKCESYICSSDDLRIANGTAYVVINQLTYENMKVKKSQINNYPVSCARCEVNLGYVIKAEGVSVPSIKITQCLIKRDKEILKKKKWKDAPFTVDMVKSSELVQCQSDFFDHLEV